MTLREIAKQRNEVAFTIIQNSFLNKKISHNYLISASQIVNIDYFLYFLAQVIYCDNEFACGKCNSCIRVARNQYTDIHILDGTKSSIKKEAILNVQKILLQTALEYKKIKLLLIKNIENTSVEGTNALLKIIEEPPQNTFILISTNKISKVLPTIKSRSQIIHLLNTPRDILIVELMDQKVPEDDAYILSIVFSSVTKSFAFFESDYPKYKKMVITFFEKWIVNKDEGQIYLLSIDYKKLDFKLFLRLFLVFLNDIWRITSHKSISFKNNISLLNKLNGENFPAIKCIECTNQLLILIDNNHNIKLQVYAWVIKMFGYNNG